MERVLVVDRAHLFPEGRAPQGFVPGADPALMERIRTGQRFEERDPVETQPDKKQIIPYTVIRQGDRYMMLRRLAMQTEARLHNKVSIGTGGHINPVDTDEGDPLEMGLRRELGEEMHIRGRCRIHHLGFVNDDATEVGRVHLGIVFGLQVLEGDVRVRERELMQGAMVVLARLQQETEAMESWSRLIVPHLDKLAWDPSSQWGGEFDLS